MTRLHRIGFAVLVGLALPASTVAGPDDNGRSGIRGRDGGDAVSVFAVGRVKAVAGSTVSVPVTVLDAPGSPLGAEKARGADVQNLSFRVHILPHDAVVDVRVERAGVASKAGVRYEAAPRTPDGVSWLASFDPQAPLQLQPRVTSTIAMLHLTLAPNVPAGTRIELRLDPAATVLANGAGTADESARNGSLQLRDGLITVR